MQTKNEYRNDSPGVIGVVTIDNGKEKGIAVKSGDSIWLSEEERIATANAPKRDGDNPFTNGTLTLVTPAAEIKNRRDIGADELPADEGEAAAEVPPVKPEPESEVSDEAKEKAASPEDAPPAPPAEDKEATAKAKAAEEAKKKQETARKAQAQKQADLPGKPVDETGAAVEPQGLPHQGQRAPKEEVATPKAPAKAGAEKG